MNPFEQELQARLEGIRGQGLYRELREVETAQGPRIDLNGREVLNFSSNDYLGLADHSRLKEVAIRAVDKFGSGSGASRLICGSLLPHHKLEAALADFKQTESALTFSSGYATALGAIGALMGKEDILILDKLVHASIVDAARLCGAKLRIFSHNDLNDLEGILKWADSRAGETGKKAHVLVVTESVFSMDGDVAPLKEIVELKEKHGAWLMVDEAHATGLYGPNRRGVAEEMGVSERVEIQMGTLGKALGAAGGYICGSRGLIELLVNRARSFIFSTAPVPAAAAAAQAGVELVKSAEGEERRARLWRLIARFSAEPTVRNCFARHEFRSAIIPIILGDEAVAMSASAALLEAGILVPAVRYPTVARGEARLRVTLTAAHTEKDVERLLSAIAEKMPASE